MRYHYPLHYIIFKQVSSHLPHEANVEEYFSRAGKISDPNMAPAHLGKLVMVGVNKKRFWPSVQAIKERYVLPQVPRRRRLERQLRGVRQLGHLAHASRGACRFVPCTGYA